MPPAPRQESAGNFALARRRKVFTGLVTFCMVTLVLGLVPAMHWMLWLNVLGDLALAVVVAFLVSLRSAKRQVASVRPRQTASRSYPTSTLAAKTFTASPRHGAVTGANRLDGRMSSPDSLWDDRQEYPSPRHLAPKTVPARLARDYMKAVPLAPGGYVLSDPFETDSSLVEDARPSRRPSVADFDEDLGEQEPLLRVGGF